MQYDNLRSMIRISYYHVTPVLLKPVNFKDVEFKGHVVMVTKLWRHSLPAMVWNAYHAPKIIMLLTNANFKKSTTWIFQNIRFLKSFNHVFISLNTAVMWGVAVVSGQQLLDLYGNAFGIQTRSSFVFLDRLQLWWTLIDCASSWVNLFLSYANNKGSDQPAHPRSLISTFVVRSLDSVILVVAMYKISRLLLVSVIAQTGLSLSWSQTARTGFLATRLDLCRLSFQFVWLSDTYSVCGVSDMLLTYFVNFR